MTLGISFASIANQIGMVMSKVQKITDRDGRLWVVIPTPSYIDGRSGQELLDVAYKLLEAGVNRLLFNMGDTRVVNSVGISRLIEMIEKFDESGGSVAFCTARPIIIKTFRIMGLLQKASVYSSVQELAASSFLPGGS